MEDGSVQEILQLYTLYRKYKKKKRRWYVRPLNISRPLKGEFSTLLKDIRYHGDSEIHHRYFRMSEERFNDLVCRLENKLKHAQTHKMPISTSERVAVTLRILASGSTQQSVAESYRLGKSTVNGIFYETCKAIWEVLSPDFVRFPTMESWKQIAEDFQVFWNFPLCLGAIDGKHVTIKAPPNSGSEFFNYKHFHSIILLAVVDARYTFSMVSIGSYGRESDGGVFSRSEFGRRMASNSLDIPAPSCLPGTNLTCPFVFVGDEAFPLKQNLMRPYSGKIYCTCFCNTVDMYRYRCFYESKFYLRCHMIDRTIYHAYNNNRSKNKQYILQKSKNSNNQIPNA